MKPTNKLNNELFNVNCNFRLILSANDIYNLAILLDVAGQNKHYKFVDLFCLVTRRVINFFKLKISLMLFHLKFLNVKQFNKIKMKIIPLISSNTLCYKHYYFFIISVETNLFLVIGQFIKMKRLYLQGVRKLDVNHVCQI